MAGPWERFTPAQPAPEQTGPWTRFAGGMAAGQPERPQLSAGETAMDVAKSAGIGLAQGAIGMATLPGNVEQLGRMGLNAASRGLGGSDLVSDETALPTYNDWKARAAGQFGEFYQPQSTAGDYARTIGEFAPAAVLGGGGIAARAANVLAPALVSETAGQATKGSAAEPWARAAGALAGGVLPRGVSPLPVDATRTGMVRQLQKEGVTALTAGQKTGSKPLRWMESVTQDTPLGGGRAKQIADTQSEQFTRAALKRAGVTADRATPDVMDTAFRDIGKKFDDLSNSTYVAADAPLLKALDDAANDYTSLVAPSLRAPVVESIVNDLKQMRGQNPSPGGGGYRGPTYQALRSKLESLRRNAGPNSAGPSDPYLSRALGDIREALDDAVERQAAVRQPNLAKEWREARSQYKNLLVIEKAMQGAGENTAQGLISASQLRTAAKQQNKRAYVRGTDDLGPLARAGEAIMKPLPQSGTAPRQMAQHLQHLVSGIGAAAGGAVGNVPGAVVGAFAPMGAQAMFSRALMSRPMQNYLSNQLAAGYMAERPAMSMNALLVPQVVDEYGGLSGRQTTGAYPPGDPRWRGER